MLASALLAGRWTERAMVARGARALRPRPRWLRAVVRAVLAAYHRPPADRPRELARFIALALDGRAGPAPSVRRVYVFAPRMRPSPWPVPPIASPGDLAAHLDVPIGHLEWLADVRGWERTAPDRRLRHYAYAWRPRPHGLARLVEAPKRRLKGIQRRILREVLDVLTAHDAAHGFRPGRSAVTAAQAHTGRHVVVRFDLEDYFAAVGAARVFGIFRLAGYPEAVAHVLTGLCTNVVPAAVWDAAPPGGDIAARARLGRRLATPHLPQGAPTSPALANLCSFGLDRRLAGLAAAMGATYTRYADDLVFSGSRSLIGGVPALSRAVVSIAAEEGFRTRADKRRVMTRAGRQQVCGVVVNDRPNVPREDADRLRAVLHEARTRGPDAANRERRPDFAAHVLGRIAWVAALNPARGAALRAQFDRVDWGDALRA